MLRRDILDREVRRRERDAQAAADEHHHHVRQSRARGEKFRVAGERDAGVVDHALVHRRGDHGVETARAGSRRPPLRACAARRRLLARIELARRHRRRQRHVDDCDAPGVEGVAARCDRTGSRMPWQARAGARVARAARRPRSRRRVLGQRLLREHHAQVGPDAGGLAGGDGDHGGRGI